MAGRPVPYLGPLGQLQAQLSAVLDQSTLRATAWAATAPARHCGRRPLTQGLPNGRG